MQSRDNLKKRVVVIGPQGDPETLAIKEFSEHCFFWEEFTHSWQILITNHQFQIELIPEKQFITIDPSLAIYLRYPPAGCDEANLAMSLIGSLCVNSIIGSQSLNDAENWNKLTQLRYFGAHAPQTIVVNSSSGLAGRDHWVVKGLSGTKTKADYLCRLKNLDHVQLPTLLQVQAHGTEYKATVFRSAGIWCYINHKAIRLHDGLDIRFGEQANSYLLLPSTPDVIKDLADKIFKRTARTYFDIDYLIDDVSGKVSILEWNDSPALGTDGMDPDGRYLKHLLFGVVEECGS